MIALIDGDIVAYRCAASAEQETEEWIPTSRADSLVNEILEATSATSHQIFISGPGNFRREIYPAYKANRKQPSPTWLKACEHYLIEQWGATITDGYEADDALGIAMSSKVDAICASIDKDLLQLPGQHYNFVKKEFISISPERALREFYISMLVGDATDNIKGVAGIGKAKAPRILEGCETEQEMFDAVREQYNNDGEMLLNGQLLWIWRTIGGIWNPVQLQEQNRELPLESIV